MLHGVDVSKWQGQIDWAKLSSKASFAFIKASQGTWSDPQFAPNWQQSEGRIVRGAYHFWHPGLSAQSQAKHFINLLKAQNDPGELPPALDLEAGPVTWQEVQAWMDTVEDALGVTPILYTSPGFAMTLGTPPKTWPLWVAHYEVKSPTLPDGRDDWLFWQYTDKGKGSEYGVESTYIDLNWFNGDWVALVRLCLGYSAEVIEQTEQPPEYVITAWLLRVRGGPGVNYPVVGRLWRGRRVFVHEVRNTGDKYSPWGKIGDKQWVSLKYAKRA